MDFVKRLLVYEPQIRVKPYTALADPFFDELREEGCRLPMGNCLPDIFNFSV